VPVIRKSLTIHVARIYQYKTGNKNSIARNERNLIRKRPRVVRIIDKNIHGHENYRRLIANSFDLSGCRRNVYNGTVHLYSLYQPSRVVTRKRNTFLGVRRPSTGSKKKKASLTNGLVIRSRLLVYALRGACAHLPDTFDLLMANGNERTAKTEEPNYPNHEPWT